MLAEVFYWVFNMSITAVITGLIILLIRAIKRIPRRVTVLLWIVPFFRMLIPIGINSPYSVMAFISRFATRTVTVYKTVSNIEISMLNGVMAADSYFPITYKTNVLDKVFDVSSFIWITVALAITITLWVIYCTTMHEIKDSTHYKDNVYFSDKLQSPAVYGIFKPRIVLPTQYKDKDIKYILMHENTHIRRKDNLWRMIAFMITAMHWFNPLAWLFLKLFLADMELACDECVLSRCSKEQAKEYALSLIDIKDNKSVFASSFGGAKIRTRIENILSFKKMTWISVLGFSLLIITIMFELLTNAG